MLVKRVQNCSRAVSVSGVLSFPFISFVSCLLGWSTTTGFYCVGTTVFRKCRVNDACDAATDIFFPPLLFRKSFDVCGGCLHFSFFLGNREKKCSYYHSSTTMWYIFSVFSCHFKTKLCSFPHFLFLILISSQNVPHWLKVLIWII